MAMIFPGMDPYLENPVTWPGVHTRFIVYLADALAARLGTRYIAAVEERVFLERHGWDLDRGGERDRSIIPDTSLRRQPPEAFGGRATAVAIEELEADEPLLIAERRREVREAYVTILDRESGQEIVTVIELLSPTNKTRGPGRESYQSKQAEVLESQAHLVEIDLLRAGKHTLAVSESTASEAVPRDYLVCVSRAWGWRNQFEIYPRRLRDRLPRIRVPLAEGDPDAVLDIQAVLAQTYDAGNYGRRLDYSKPCIPPLSPEDQAWADALAREAHAIPPPA